MIRSQWRIEAAEFRMNFVSLRLMLSGFCYAALMLLGGCFTSLVPTAAPDADAAPLPSPVLVTLPPDSATASPYPWSDENTSISGICFEAALDAAGRVFVLRTPEEHIQFYNLADNSGLCARPVLRLPFEFGGGRVLAGLWSAGSGCTARHDVLDYSRDDAARRFSVTLRFVTAGDCPYELVRPFWIGLNDAAGYEVQITVQ